MKRAALWGFALALGVLGCDRQGGMRVKGIASSSANVLAPCAADPHCPEGFYCTTADGVCGQRPDCKAGQACSHLCWGLCEARIVATKR